MSEFRLVHADQFARGQEEIKVFKGKVSVVAQVLQHAKDVLLVLFYLGPLRTMAAVFNLQFVEAETVGELVQLGRVGIGDIKPRNTGQRLLGWAHQQAV